MPDTVPGKIFAMQMEFDPYKKYEWLIFAANENQKIPLVFGHIGPSYSMELFAYREKLLQLRRDLTRFGEMPRILASEEVFQEIIKVFSLVPDCIAYCDYAGKLRRIKF